MQATEPSTASNTRPIKAVKQDAHPKGADQNKYQPKRPETAQHLIVPDPNPAPVSCPILMMQCVCAPRTLAIQLEEPINRQRPDDFWVPSHDALSLQSHAFSLSHHMSCGAVRERSGVSACRKCAAFVNRAHRKWAVLRKRVRRSRKSKARWNQQQKKKKKCLLLQSDDVPKKKEKFESGERCSER